MHKKQARLIATLLTFAMCLSIFAPTAAYAAASVDGDAGTVSYAADLEAQLSDYLDDNQDLILTNDALYEIEEKPQAVLDALPFTIDTGADPITITLKEQTGEAAGKAIVLGRQLILKATATLDLNGQTLQGPDGKYAVVVQGSGDLKVTDSAETKGSITSAHGISVEADSSLTLENAKIVATATDGQGIWTNGKVSIANTDANATITGYYGIIANGEDADITINAGTISGTYGIWEQYGAKVTVNKASITGTTRGIHMSGSSTCTVTSANAEDVTIKGRYAVYIVNGYVNSSNAPTYSTTDSDDLAKTNPTFKMTKGTIKSDTDYGVYVNGKATVELDGTAIDARNGVYANGTVPDTTDENGEPVDNAAKIVLKNSTITGTKYTSGEKSYAAWGVNGQNNVSIELTDTDIIVTGDNSPRGVNVCGYSSDVKAEFTMNSGSIQSDYIGAYAWQYSDAEFIGTENYSKYGFVAKNSTGVTSESPVTTLTLNGAKVGVIPTGSDDKTTKTVYAVEAYNDVNVIVKNNSNLVASSMGIYLVGNADTKYLTEENSYRAKATVLNSNITAGDHAIEVLSQASCVIGEENQDDTSKIDGGSVGVYIGYYEYKTSDGTAVYQRNDANYRRPNLTVNGGEITGDIYAICGNGNDDYTKITINGGTVKTPTYAAIFHPQIGDLTITGGTIESPANGIEFCGAGTLDISGENTLIKGTAETRYETPWKDTSQGDGSNLDGSAVALMLRGGGYQTAEDTFNVNISGGTLEGTNNAALRVYFFSQPGGTGNAWVTTKLDAVANLINLNITGGTFNGGSLDETTVKAIEIDTDTLKGGKANITGGTFSVAPDDSYLGATYYAEKNEDNTYTVKSSVDTQSGIYTLSKNTALGALIEDVKTYDLNGFTLTYTGGTITTSGLTFKDSSEGKGGTLVLNNDSTTDGVAIKPAIEGEGTTGTVTIEDITVTVATDNEQISTVLEVGENVTAEIKNSQINVVTKDGETETSKAAATGILVSGGTLTVDKDSQKTSTINGATTGIDLTAGSATVNGAAITGGTQGVKAAGETTAAATSFTMNGGTITGTTYGVNAENNADVNIKGTTIDAITGVLANDTRGAVATTRMPVVTLDGATVGVLTGEEDAKTTQTVNAVLIWNGAAVNVTNDSQLTSTGITIYSQGNKDGKETHAEDKKSDYRAQVTVADSTIKSLGTGTEKAEDDGNSRGIKAEYSTELTVDNATITARYAGIYVNWDSSCEIDGDTTGETKIGTEEDAPQYGIVVIAYSKGEVAANANLKANHPVLTVNNGEIYGVENAISGNGTNGYYTEITVKGGTIKSTGESGTAIYQPQSGTLTISDGTIEGAGSAVGIKSGTLNITGGTLTGTGKATIPTTGYSNGINASGAAVQIESNDDYGDRTTKTTDDEIQNNSGIEPNVIINITGGTLTSQQSVAIYEYIGKGTDSHLKLLSISGSATVTSGGSYPAIMTSTEAIKQSLEETTTWPTPKTVFNITGGEFSSDLSYQADETASLKAGSYLDPNEYQANANKETSTWTVKPATIQDTESGVTTDKENKTVTLLKDYTTDTLLPGYSYALNGCTLTYTGSAVTDNVSIQGWSSKLSEGGTLVLNSSTAETVFTPASGKTVELTNVTVKTAENNTTVKAVAAAATGAEIKLTNAAISGVETGIAVSGGTATITGSTIDATGNAVAVTGGTVDITNSKLNTADGTGAPALAIRGTAAAATVNLSGPVNEKDTDATHVTIVGKAATEAQTITVTGDSNKATLNVNSGTTVYGTKLKKDGTASKAAITLNEGSQFEADQNNNFVQENYIDKQQEESGLYKVVPILGETTDEGGATTLTLEKTQTISAADLKENVTYDLNGYTLTITGKVDKALNITADPNKGGQLVLSDAATVFAPDEGETVNISNVKIQSKGESTGAIIAPNGGTVNVTSCNVTAAGLVADVASGEVNIVDSILNGKNGATEDSSDQVLLNVTGGALNLKNTDENVTKGQTTVNGLVTKAKDATGTVAVQDGVNFNVTEGNAAALNALLEAAQQCLLAEGDAYKVYAQITVNWSDAKAAITKSKSSTGVIAVDTPELATVNAQAPNALAINNFVTAVNGVVLPKTTWQAVFSTDNADAATVSIQPIDLGEQTLAAWLSAKIAAYVEQAEAGDDYAAVLANASRFPLGEGAPEAAVQFIDAPVIKNGDADATTLGLVYGQTAQLTLTLPEAYDKETVTTTWTSSDDSAVTVDENGNVKAVNVPEENVTITVAVSVTGVPEMNTSASIAVNVAKQTPNVTATAKADAAKDESGNAIITGEPTAEKIKAAFDFAVTDLYDTDADLTASFDAEIAINEAENTATVTFTPKDSKSNYDANSTTIAWVTGEEQPTPPDEEPYYEQQTVDLNESVVESIQKDDAAKQAIETLFGDEEIDLSEDDAQQKIEKKLLDTIMQKLDLEKADEPDESNDKVKVTASAVYDITYTTEDGKQQKNNDFGDDGLLIQLPYPDEGKSEYYVVAHLIMHSDDITKPNGSIEYLPIEDKDADGLYVYVSSLSLFSVLAVDGEVELPKAQTTSGAVGGAGSDEPGAAAAPKDNTGLIIAVGAVAVTAVVGGVIAYNWDKLPVHKIEGTVVDANGAAVANATVELVKDGKVVKTLTTDVNGYYSAKVAKGEYTITATVGESTATAAGSTGAAAQLAIA